MIKRIPRIDGPDLVIDDYEDGFYVDVYAAFGLPPFGWLEYVPKR